MDAARLTLDYLALKDPQIPMVKWANKSVSQSPKLKIFCIWQLEGNWENVLALSCVCVSVCIYNV